MAVCHYLNSRVSCALVSKLTNVVESLHQSFIGFGWMKPYFGVSNLT